jgi:hypothetical protein
MNTVDDMTRLVDELAALWTEPALEILSATGMQSITVDMEVEMWGILKDVLHTELRWQRAFRSSTVVSLRMLMEQVFRTAASFVYQRHTPWPIPYEFSARVRRFAADRRATMAERSLYMEIIRQPRLRAAFKLPSRSDFVPRFRLSVGAR